MSPRALPHLAMEPVELALRQLQLDRAATAEIPSLQARKRDRQLASPHALVRGSAARAVPGLGAALLRVAGGAPGAVGGAGGRGLAGGGHAPGECRRLPDRWR